MITKAYIEEIEDNYTVKVRIPIFNKSRESSDCTPTSELNKAYFLTLPNLRITPQIGDTVIVGFENNDRSKPVILGFLYCNKKEESISDTILHSLVVDGEAVLPSNTSIGGISSKQISFLSNLREDVQIQIDQILYRLTTLESK